MKSTRWLIFRPRPITTRGFQTHCAQDILQVLTKNKRLKLKKHFYFSIFGTNLSCSFKKKPKSSHIFEHLRNTTEPVVHLSGPIHTQLGCLIDRKAEMEIAR
jgi:SMC interacting uncharacterized protein involved in chromosome segregation